jgi:hypothetical protein
LKLKPREERSEKTSSTTERKIPTVKTSQILKRMSSEDPDAVEVLLRKTDLSEAIWMTCLNAPKISILISQHLVPQTFEVQGHKEHF